MLLGEYDHTIDEKNRLTLPAKFRAAFAAGVVITRGLDTCLNVFGGADWHRLVEARLAPLDPLSGEARTLQRFFYAGAVEAEPDRQGRVMLPPALLEHAGLGREVTVVGLGDRLEIWDRTAWRKQLDEVKGSAEDVAERLATKRD